MEEFIKTLFQHFLTAPRRAEVTSKDDVANVEDFRKNYEK